MRHGAVQRNAEPLAGEHRRRAGKAYEVTRARRQQAGLGAVRAPHAEIDQEFAGRGQHHARGFRRDQRLEMQDIDQPRLDELRLRQRRGHAQDRLVGEEHAALGDGVHVAGETQRGEIIDEVFAESAGAFQPGDFTVGETQGLKVIKRLLQPGGDEEAAPGRQVADEKFEYGGFRLAMVQIGLDHVDLVEVGQ